LLKEEERRDDKDKDKINKIENRKYKWRKS
jgi:hypothetical protein